MRAIDSSHKITPMRSLVKNFFNFLPDPKLDFKHNFLGFYAQARITMYGTKSEIGQDIGPVLASDSSCALHAAAI